ncbi:hypothetical protein ACFTSF_04520 [Kribbella sp. NPDC056951]|uniref:hypothetical protein n=1 Tax=Kribbella sp. NPDC056951 TaxID=3345978 RepID=UPI00362648E9
MHHHVPAPRAVLSPEVSAGEVRARWGCGELAVKFGIDAVPAHDEHGAATGRVAIEPDELQEAIHNYHADTDKEGS